MASISNIKQPLSSNATLNANMPTTKINKGVNIESRKTNNASEKFDIKKSPSITQEDFNKLIKNSVSENFKADFTSTIDANILINHNKKVELESENNNLASKIQEIKEEKNSIIDELDRNSLSDNDSNEIIKDKKEKYNIDSEKLTKLNNEIKELEGKVTKNDKELSSLNSGFSSKIEKEVKVLEQKTSKLNNLENKMMKLLEGDSDIDVQNNSVLNEETKITEKEYKTTLEKNINATIKDINNIKSSLKSIKADLTIKSDRKDKEYSENKSGSFTRDIDARKEGISNNDSSIKTINESIEDLKEQQGILENNIKEKTKEIHENESFSSLTKLKGSLKDEKLNNAISKRFNIFPSSRKEKSTSQKKVHDALSEYKNLKSFNETNEVKEKIDNIISKHSSKIDSTDLQFIKKLINKKESSVIAKVNNETKDTKNNIKNNKKSINSKRNIIKEYDNDNIKKNSEIHTLEKELSDEHQKIDYNNAISSVIRSNLEVFNKLVSETLLEPLTESESTRRSESTAH